jgi:hypothetical protein
MVLLIISHRRCNQLQMPLRNSHACTQLHTSTHTCLQAHTDVHRVTHTHTHTHIYTHSLTHTYAHTGGGIKDKAGEMSTGNIRALIQALPQYRDLLAKLSLHIQVGGCSRAGLPLFAPSLLSILLRPGLGWRK